MKKAIILLSSLFFIMMLSIMILDNLNKSDSLLDMHSEEVASSHGLLLVNNFKEEIGKLLFQHKENLDVIFSDESTKIFPLSFAEVQSQVELFKIEEAYNINHIFSKDEKKYKQLEQFFLENDADYEGFKYFVTVYLNQMDSNLKEFKSQKEFEKVIDLYIKQSGFTEVSKIASRLRLFDATKESKFIECFIHFDIQKNIYSSSFIYNLDELQENLIKVSEFDFTFK